MMFRIPFTLKTSLKGSNKKLISYSALNSEPTTFISRGEITVKTTHRIGLSVLKERKL